MKVLFLDIDGVLNSRKTALAMGGFPFDFEGDRDKFDWVAVALVRNFCKTFDVQIVLSSAWRLHYPIAEVAAGLDLPILDATAAYSPNGSLRGHQIQDWLDAHPEVEEYAILDDNSDMLESQSDNFVLTKEADGLTYNDMLRLGQIFDVQVWAAKPVRERINEAKALNNQAPQ